MNYLMLVCSEDAPPPPDVPDVAEPSIEDWIELCGKRRVYGEALSAPASARTVRVRDGELLVSDGPFIEAKEFIAGFDLLSCVDLDEAIGLAAAHPVAGRRMLELRPLGVDVSLDGVGERLSAAEGAPGQRFMMQISINGISEGDEVEARLDRESRAWGEALEAEGRLLFGAPLQGPETATTVRLRASGTLLSDGPFVEAKEFLAGMSVLNCADLDEAVALVSSFPLAAYHPVEIRPFMVWED